MSEAPHYNGQSDPQLQAIAEAERERFRKQNGAGVGGHQRKRRRRGTAMDRRALSSRMGTAGQVIRRREWIMEDWIPCGQTTGLYGVSGVLKTTFLIQLMMAASAGLVFCGRTACRRCRHMACFARTLTTEIVRRTALIAASYELDLDAVSRFPFRLTGRGQRIAKSLFDFDKRQIRAAAQSLFTCLPSKSACTKRNSPCSTPCPISSAARKSTGARPRALSACSNGARHGLRLRHRRFSAIPRCAAALRAAQQREYRHRGQDARPPDPA